MTELGEGVSRIHLLFDMTIIDATSILVLMAEIISCYYGHPTTTPIKSFRSFCMQQDPEDEAQAAQQYWLPRLDSVPGPPDLARPKFLVPGQEGFFANLQHTIDANAWSSLREVAESLHAIPTCAAVGHLVPPLAHEGADSTDTVDGQFPRMPAQVRAYGGAV